MENYKKQQDLKNTPQTRLYNAITNGNLAAVKTELDGGIPINSILVENYTPLLLAASHVDATIVEELLKRGADPATHKGIHLKFQTRVHGLDLSI